MMRLTRLTLCSGQTGTFMMIVLAIGIGDDADVLVDLLGIHLRHDQRNAVLHAEGAGVVDDDRPGRDGRGANSLLIDPPAEKSAICTPLKLSFVVSSSIR